jgi:PKD repeat protein
MVSSSVLFGQNLTANFSVNEIEICLGEIVDFTDLSTAGNSPILAWTWDFGDGFSSQVQNPTHIFTAAGTYNITLTVQAQDGTSDVEIKQVFIIVHPLPQVIFIKQSRLQCAF